jgi:hypothetical protein
MDSRDYTWLLKHAIYVHELLTWSIDAAMHALRKTPQKILRELRMGFVQYQKLDFLVMKPQAQNVKRIRATRFSAHSCRAFCCVAVCLPVCHAVQKPDNGRSGKVLKVNMNC